MRVLVQRCESGSVTVAGEVTGSVQKGLVLLVGIGHQDHPAVVRKMADKVANLRIFNNEEGKFSKSVLDTGGEILVVSQFTLFADLKKGRRPSFSLAAPPEQAEELIRQFMQALSSCGIRKVASGVFGAHMKVALCNDGPVTIWLDSDEAFPQLKK